LFLNLANFICLLRAENLSGFPSLECALLNTHTHCKHLQHLLGERVECYKLKSNLQATWQV